MIKSILAATAVLAATQAGATITLDGNYESDYGTGVAVAHDDAAPNSNFSAPSATTEGPGYTVYFKGQNGAVWVLFQATGAIGGNNFANLYVDIDPNAPAGPSSGSDMIIGVNGNGSAYAADFDTFAQHPLSGITVASTATSLEFRIPNSVFSMPISGFNYFGAAAPGVGDLIRLRATQSLGYTYVGGASFGADRLGSTTLAGAVPEPAAWALMIGGFGLAGGAMRRRRTLVAA
ncbi:hypothetical protein SPAN111604_04715 [Sphingomonas antarctica]|uniref:PEPxxWA-CTERM sorting domain-containing protein n=1 Tax=Sphingomonas antarctica TaxID=2040274 RepID=UPI0039EB56F3